MQFYHQDNGLNRLVFQAGLCAKRQNTVAQNIPDIIPGAEHAFLKEPYFSQALEKVVEYLKANGIAK